MIIKLSRTQSFGSQSSSSCLIELRINLVCYQKKKKLTF